ncbi:DNA ligase (ATP) [Diatrype stigma]|uniref:DNA ligase n=1 Tax=Diatrype stigma TaxID=117547 RepID=A0AAN9YMQ0_9PEZI
MATLLKNLMRSEWAEAKYPNRPQNHGRTLYFWELPQSLFNPLNENKKQPSGPSAVRHRKGVRGLSKISPHEQRRNIIERFITRWRQEVGNDIYPALRLILPHKDPSRGVYGLKESNIGKLLVKLMKIDRNSEDGYNLLHWKLPGQTTASRMAGDFAGRCYEVLSKRPMRIDPGELRIAEVNQLLDKLAAASGEKEQLPIFETFYQHMNPEELMWLIRIILKQMKVGATEKTFLSLWHPDADKIFSVSSDLRRVCWEVTDPSVILDDSCTQITLMQCFQPQLANFQTSASFEKMIERLNKSTPSPDDKEYWIEEKLDGERMQLHMQEDDNMPGGKRFCFWSRKATTYTHIYGDSFHDESALTRFIKNAFAPGVRNIILDGEMITWDAESDKIMKFGGLKTAALAERRNPREDGPRPVFRVFDILYLNDTPLTQYTMRDRRNALEKAVLGEPRRLEVHPYTKATTADVIESSLRQVVADAGEGLVLKNPRSAYQLNARNDDWIKVKPEYMEEWGGNFDCVVIGGYFGSGYRGGRLSSFLCGLRATENDIKAGANPEKCYSFCKVGGGFLGEDFARIRHLTDGKWTPWDASQPPTKYIELGGSGRDRQAEKPDVWIRPSQSVVISIKAASIGASDKFAKNITLRFPRFRALKSDKRWDQALDYDEFLANGREAEAKMNEKKMTIEKKRQANKRRKKEVVIVGQGGGDAAAEFAPRPLVGTGTGIGASHTKVFESLEFCVLTDCVAPVKKTKAQLEALIKASGGKISQRANTSPDSRQLLLADKKVVKVASLIKAGEKEGRDVDIIRPRWVLDCLAQQQHQQQQRDADFLLPFEMAHLFHASDAMRALAQENTDAYGDSYARDLSLKELREILDGMPKKQNNTLDSEPFDKDGFLDRLAEQGHDLGLLKGHIFRKRTIYLAHTNDGLPELEFLALKLANWIRFGGGRVTENLEDESVTHVVILSANAAGECEKAGEVRAAVGVRSRLPRIVTRQWVEACWENSTLVDEERYEPL